MAQVRDLIAEEVKPKLGLAVRLHRGF